MKYLNRIGLILAALLTVQCTEEGDKLYPIVENPGWTAVAEDFVAEAPDWQADAAGTASAPEWTLDMQGTDTLPTWNEPDKSIYPTSMTAVVRLTPFLERYATEDDVMAAFIGDECRGVASRIEVDGKALYFVLVKAADDEAGNVEFRYYNTQTNTLYHSVAEEVPYEINKVYGTPDAPEYPDFEQSGRYPHVLDAVVTVDPTEVGLVPAEGDMLMAFVDGAPRAIVHNVAEQVYTLEVRAKSIDEKVTFKYYSAAANAVYRAVEVAIAGEAVYGTAETPQALTLVPEVSMVAYVEVPEVLASIATPDDKVAAFIDDICCGVGEQLDGGAYKIIVKGYEGQEDKLTFKYYNARCKYMYTAADCVDFGNGSEVGNVAEPYIMPLAVEGKHPLKMTATFCMDADFARGAAEGDLVAAFVGDECRGVATSLVTADGTRVYCMEINGSVSGDERVKMKYYSARKSYLYETEGTFRFAADMVYGTEEAPKQLVLVHVM